MVIAESSSTKSRVSIERRGGGERERDDFLLHETRRLIISIPGDLSAKFQPAIAWNNALAVPFN